MRDRFISEIGGYLPILRLDRTAAARALRFAGLGGRGAGHRAVAGWDEDALTMAVEAARGLTPAARLIFASTSAPFFDRSQATEDLGLSDEGRALFDVLDGRYDAGGAIPCQIDGGLKCFGHPVGASGLRMAYEVYTQLEGRAGARQRADMDFGLTHNLGGSPFNSVAAVSILGRLN